MAALTLSACTSTTVRRDPTCEGETCEPNESTVPTGESEVAAGYEPRIDKAMLGEELCPDGSNIVVLTPGSDIYMSVSGDCILANGGADTISNVFNAEVTVLGGDGNDALGVGDRSVLWGGPGNDNVSGTANLLRVFLGEGNDTVNLPATIDSRIAGDEGHDTISIFGGGQYAVDGGKGDDGIFVTGVDNDLSGGADNDTIVFSGAGTRLIGGPGNDVLSVTGPNNVVHPGQGVDAVTLSGPGSVVVIADACEVEPGESYTLGPGLTLKSGVPQVELAALGVPVLSFASFEYDPALATTSDCNPCGCVAENGTVECCNGVGTCDAGGESITTCSCFPGHTGDDCSIHCGPRCEDVPGAPGCGQCGMTAPGGPGCEPFLCQVQPGSPGVPICDPGACDHLPPGTSFCVPDPDPLCEARVYRGSDGGMEGITITGRSFFEATDSVQALAQFREYVAEHAHLFGLAPIMATEIDNFTHLDTRDDDPLAIHRYVQDYRGYPIHGSGSELKLTTAEHGGTISIDGRVIDERIDYDGTLGVTIDPLTAETEITAAWQLAYPAATGITVEGTEMVAIPSAKTLGYRARVNADPFGGSVVITAVAPAQTLSVVDERNFFELPITVRADDWDRWPSSATSQVGTSVFSQSRTYDSTAPLVGVDVPDDVCSPSSSDCVMLSNGRLFVYNGNNGYSYALDENYPLITDGNASFDASPNPADPLNFVAQNYFHKMVSAQAVASTIMECRWDWHPQWGQDACDEPQVLTLVNTVADVDSDGNRDFAGQFRGPETTTNAIMTGGGVLQPAWTNRYLDLDVNPEGLVAPATIWIDKSITGPSVTYHEFGHLLDWFSTPGIGGIIGNMQASYSARNSCMRRTPDEAYALGETIADLWMLYFLRKLHAEIPQGDPVTIKYRNAHTPGGDPSALFESDEENDPIDRPKAVDPAGNGCFNMEGYKTASLRQAFWEFADGVDSGSGPGVPLSYVLLPALTDSEGAPTLHVDALGKALKWGLDHQLSTGSSYEHLFDAMGMYIECEYGRDAFLDYQAIFAHHGLSPFGPLPRACPEICGNAKIGDGEQCDGPELAGTTCTDLGFSGGSLTCGIDCTFDTSECTICGDGFVNGNEDCDGEDFDGETCDSATNGTHVYGFLVCNDCAIETSACLDCEPGTNNCRCLDVDNPGEDVDLPGNGIHGDGQYCLDDVTFGGTRRCHHDGNAFYCDECSDGGPGSGGDWCLCYPFPDQGIVDLDGPCSGGGFCRAALSAYGVGDPPETALPHGYCLEGDVLDWFYDNYCAQSSQYEDLVCVYTVDGGNRCGPSGPDQDECTAPEP